MYFDGLMNAICCTSRTIDLLVFYAFIVTNDISEAKWLSWLIQHGQVVVGLAILNKTFPNWQWQLQKTCNCTINKNVLK